MRGTRLIFGTLGIIACLVPGAGVGSASADGAETRPPATLAGRADRRDTSWTAPALVISPPREIRLSPARPDWSAATFFSLNAFELKLKKRTEADKPESADEPQPDADADDPEEKTVDRTETAGSESEPETEPEPEITSTLPTGDGAGPEVLRDPASATELDTLRRLESDAFLFYYRKDLEGDDAVTIPFLVPRKEILRFRGLDETPPARATYIRD